MSRELAPSVGVAKSGSSSRMFGKYELVEQLGRGGMAEVWKAKIRGVAGFERTLVIKRILPQLIRDEEFVAMFVREAQLCSMLSHANIVQVFELGELENEYYLAMEYVRGRDLHALMQSRPKEPPPPGLAAFVGRDVCRALGYAHALKDERGQPLRLIHRDVTPSNVMLTVDGAIKLVDFGVAKALAMASASLTAAGSIKGKLSYMSPEQITGGEIDHRTDLFAVGILVHETLTGRRLFKGETDEETVDRVLEGTIYPPSQLNPSVPRELDAVVMRALDRDPRRRFQSGDELADALEICVHQLKWGPAQLTSILRERFPDLDGQQISATHRPRATQPPVAPSGSVTGLSATDTPQQQNAFDVPTQFDPSGPRGASGSSGFKNTELSTTSRDARKHRPTLPLVRAIDEMGQWTVAEEQRESSEGARTTDPGALPPPPSRPGRSSEEMATIPMSALRLDGNTPQDPLPYGPTVMHGRSSEAPLAAQATVMHRPSEQPLPAQPTVMSNKPPPSALPSAPTKMHQLTQSASVSAPLPMRARAPQASLITDEWSAITSDHGRKLGLRLALIIAAALFLTAGITYYLHARQQAAMEAPAPPASREPLARPSAAPPLSDKVTAPTPIADPPPALLQPFAEEPPVRRGASRKEHRVRAPAPAAAQVRDEPAPRPEPRPRPRRSGDIERGDVVDPF